MDQKNQETQEITVLLVEDDVEECNELQNYADSVNDVNLVGITNNSDEALEMVQAFLPDVVLLDLELHQGGGNGLLFLLGLSRLNLPFRPYIIIITHNVSQVTFESARQLGADFILAKYETGYSAQYVIEFIRMTKPAILSHRENQSDSKPPPYPQPAGTQNPSAHPAGTDTDRHQSEGHRSLLPGRRHLPDDPEPGAEHRPRPGEKIRQVRRQH